MTSEETQAIDPCAPDQATTDRLLGGAHHDPHGILGAHPHADGTVVRVLRPHAEAVHVLPNGDVDLAHPLTKVHDAGLFSGLVPGSGGDYRLLVDYGDGAEHIVDDPYRWLPTLGDVDLHLIGEGRHERLWDVLGSHLQSYDTASGPVTGTSFAVWAPNAQGVRVTGDFDGWAGWSLPMRSLGSSGVWEIFLPDVGVGARYKFRILGQDGKWRDKADPMAFATEIPPQTASVVTTPVHEWGDGDWMAARADRKPHAEPMSVYELHLGSWVPGLDYREIADRLVAYLDRTGFTHVELLPVAEHPFGGSWGYQVTSYFAPTSRFGTPDDFRYFVDTLHRAGYGVIVDWVPAHFPRDEWALAKFDGTACYEHADPRRGEQPDWGTLVFDFGRNEVRNFLVANALYWLESFHIDGLRVDAVASMLYLDYSRADGAWLPNIHGGRENLDAVAFLQEMNATVYREHPGAVTIAEESTAWPGVTRPTYMGGLGFGLKWNMGWMHDTLDYTGRDPIHRSFHHNQLTFSLMYAFSENYVLPISHDEVVHGKGSLWTRMPGDDWNKAAGVRALLAYMWAHPGKQLLFMGSEFGQPREWSEQRSLDWHLQETDPLHGGITSLVGDLNRVYREHSALWVKDSTPDGFAWIDANDAAGNVLSFLRHGTDAAGRATVLACVANFSGAPNENYRVGLPFAGRWTEVLNTDAASYGGSGVGNLGTVVAENQMWHGQPASAALRLPPSGVLWLVPEDTGGPVHPLGSAAETVPVASVPPAVTASEIPPVPEETDVPAPITPGDVTSSLVPGPGAVPPVAESVPQPVTVPEPVAVPEPGDPVPALDPERSEPVLDPDETLPVPDAEPTPAPTVTPSTSGAPGVRATRTGRFVTGTSGAGTSATGSSENGSSPGA
ncbi:1,4-alpha-glucan branching enzyme [Pseudonocardia sediminis]|uniref:1,4-alpha-glucan branching enzyme GlgB n=1 Tax=Pseudonocardia sediminis TaxID=1397368 RepID=A0A4Q7V0N7_PSEST|nr:1,4-alpha-glucan branching protein GlgB [Pseudonocardia sediminis]RZT88022.1 1,4-alpha-glucan branching enzyme [Pseudonocardia sediminis]